MMFHKITFTVQSFKVHIFAIESKGIFLKVTFKRAQVIKSVSTANSSDVREDTGEEQHSIKIMLRYMYEVNNFGLIISNQYLGFTVNAKPCFAFTIYY